VWFLRYASGQTDRHVYYNSAHPSRGWSNKSVNMWQSRDAVVDDVRLCYSSWWSKFESRFSDKHHVTWHDMLLTLHCIPRLTVFSVPSGIFNIMSNMMVVVFYFIFHFVSLFYFFLNFNHFNWEVNADFVDLEVRNWAQCDCRLIVLTTASLTRAISSMQTRQTQTQTDRRSQGNANVKAKFSSSKDNAASFCRVSLISD